MGIKIKSGGIGNIELSTNEIKARNKLAFGFPAWDNVQ